MTFRANEEAVENFGYALSKLSRGDTFTSSQKTDIHHWLEDTTARWGPVVHLYPSWHPLVSCRVKEDANPITQPSDLCGYPEMDHTVYLRNGFLTCPYSNGEKLLKAVDEMRYPKCVTVEANRVEIPIYAENANPILVTCDWHHGDQPDGTISQRSAVALMLIEELRCWNEASVAERWDTMRPYLLGRPCGSRSSLFVNQRTGQAMKKAFEAMVMGGTFGPLRLD